MYSHSQTYSRVKTLFRKKLKNKLYKVFYSTTFRFQKFKLLQMGEGDFMAVHVNSLFVSFCLPIYFLACGDCTAVHVNSLVCLILPSYLFFGMGGLHGSSCKFSFLSHSAFLSIFGMRGFYGSSSKFSVCLILPSCSRILGLLCSLSLTNSNADKPMKKTVEIGLFFFFIHILVF